MNSIAIKYLLDNSGTDMFVFVYNDTMVIKALNNPNDMNNLFDSVRTVLFGGKYYPHKSLAKLIICNSYDYIDKYYQLDHIRIDIYANIGLRELLHMIPLSDNHYVPIMFNIIVKVLGIDRLRTRELVGMYYKIARGTDNRDELVDRAGLSDTLSNIMRFRKVRWQIKWSKEEMSKPIRVKTLAKKYKHLVSTNPAFDLKFLLSPKIKTLYDLLFG